MTMTVSKDQKQKLRKKLRAAKRAPVTKGIDSKLFKLANKDSNANKPLSIEYKIPPLPPNLLQDAVNMFEENMGIMYQNSSWGLDLKDKRDELRHQNARFLLVHDNKADSNNGKDKNTMVGYCHFRFENDDEDEPTEAVVYVYELQVSSKYQHCGIGRRLMELTHEIARRAGLKKVMLTVFTANDAALRFYKNLGYVIDTISPSMGGQQCDYEIMSIVLDQMPSEPC
jgi:GNAT superfamily N-acetyltransferase